MDVENQPGEGWGVGILARTLLVFFLTLLAMGLIAFLSR